MILLSAESLCVPSASPSTLPLQTQCGLHLYIHPQAKKTQAAEDSAQQPRMQDLTLQIVLHRSES